MPKNMQNITSLSSAHHRLYFTLLPENVYKSTTFWFKVVQNSFTWEHVWHYSCASEIVFRRQMLHCLEEAGPTWLTLKALPKWRKKYSCEISFKRKIKVASFWSYFIITKNKSKSHAKWIRKYFGCLYDVLI